MVTSRGGLAVEKIEIGDVVLGPNGDWRRVVWVCETQQDVDDRAGTQTAFKTGAASKTRFPGVRFVSGRPATRLYQVIFAPSTVAPRDNTFEVSPEFQPVSGDEGPSVDKAPAAKQLPRMPSFISVRATPKSPLEIA